MSIQEVDNMRQYKKGAWIPIKTGNGENLEVGKDDNVNNGEYCITSSYINYPGIYKHSVPGPTYLTHPII